MCGVGVARAADIKILSIGLMKDAHLPHLHLPLGFFSQQGSWGPRHQLTVWRSSLTSVVAGSGKDAAAQSR